MTGDQIRNPRWSMTALFLLGLVFLVNGFGSPCKLSSFAPPKHGIDSRSFLRMHREESARGGKKRATVPVAVVSTVAAAAIFGSSFGPTVQPAFAYDAADYATETVTSAVMNLKRTSGSNDASFGALKDVADIITEGKGVGGSLSYGGVQLERGLVADEDTAIYNPGLSLLTESEKERLVEAIIQNRRSNIEQNTWSNDNESGYEFVKTKLDPLHMAELSGYLSILPIYGAIVYLGTLFVQQNVRSLFPVAYIAGVVAIVGPVLVLVANGS